MYLIHPGATSVMWMNPSRRSPGSNLISSALSGFFARRMSFCRPFSVGYSSSHTNAPKFFTSCTVHTTSSLTSGRSSPRGILLHRPEDLPLDVRDAAGRPRERGAADKADHDGRGPVEHDLLAPAVLALHLQEPPARLGDHAWTSTSSNFFARMPGRWCAFLHSLQRYRRYTRFVGFSRPSGFGRG